MSNTLNRNDVLGGLATMLDVEPSALEENANLTELGLDSLRMITLVEGWRAEGVEIDFQELMANPTVGHWVATLTEPEA